MGAIMSIGVASANSILLVTFAREHSEATGCSAVEAAIMAGRTRLRMFAVYAGRGAGAWALRVLILVALLGPVWK